MGLKSYLIRRLLLIIPVFLFVSLLNFSMIHFAPGDPVRMMVNPQLGQEAIEQRREELGLNEPLPNQYLIFMRRLLTGDWGRSIYTRESISHMITSRLANTLNLTVISLFMAILIAIPSGMIAAKFRGRLPDYITMFYSIIGLSIPQFWLGLILMLIFGVYLGWFPVAGYGTIQHLVLPVITLTAYFIGLMARMTRSSMLEVMSEDYITTARSKGLAERIIMWKHALRNALCPIISLLGLQVGWLLGGAVVVEQVFNRPGLGRLIIASFHRRDYPVIQILLLILVVSVIIGNLLADFGYGLINPRIRYE